MSGIVCEIYKNWNVTVKAHVNKVVFMTDIKFGWSCVSSYISNPGFVYKQKPLFLSHFYTKNYIKTAVTMVFPSGPEHTGSRFLSMKCIN